MLQNLRIGLKKRRNGKSDVPVKQRGGWPKISLNYYRNNKAAFFSPSENWCLSAPSTLQPEEREFVVDSGASMHMISKKDLNSGELETVTTSRSPTTVFYSQWWSADEWTGHSLCQRIGYILDNESLRGYASSFIARKALRWTDTHEINGQKPHLIKNGNRIQCNTENFVPIVVPDLSTSSSSSLPTSTPITPVRQEIDHSKSSSSSSTSTPMTSSTEIDHSDHPPTIVSNESVDRQVRRHPYGTDHHPAIVSSESVERQVRWDPYSSETSEELLNKPTKAPKPK